MILTGDCIEVMAGMEADSVDAVVTDPPYGLEFMWKEWDRFATTKRKAELTPRGQGHSTSAGPFLAHAVNEYRAGSPFQAWCEAWGREALRVTKPGGYLLAFGGTRTHHRLVCGLEDAGWIIRDELDWIYASGFPKGKANLKPAHEPIVLARKPGPLRPLAIDECRIPGEPWQAHDATGLAKVKFFTNGETPVIHKEPHSGGRWPSNVLLSEPDLFDSASGGYSRFFIVPKADRSDREPVLRGQLDGNSVWSDGREVAADYPSQRGKTSRENGHPTVKPTDLMRHLVRLVTPVGGTVLDCFLGSGSTAIAAEMEGFAWIGIEKEPEYVAIAEARLNGVQRGLGLDLTGAL